MGGPVTYQYFFTHPERAVMTILTPTPKIVPNKSISTLISSEQCSNGCKLVSVMNAFSNFLSPSIQIIQVLLMTKNLSAPFFPMLTTAFIMRNHHTAKSSCGHLCHHH